MLFGTRQLGMVSTVRRFSDFSDAFESFTTSVYAEAVAKGIDKPADGLLRMFYKRLGPDHPAVEQMATHA